MDVLVYEVLLHFNQGLTEALASLDIIEKLEMAAPNYVSKVRTNLSEMRAEANNHLACEIAQKEQEEENHFHRIRRKREKTEEDPNDIYHDLKAREALRHERGLPPRAVILPWSQAEDDRILALQKPAASEPLSEPEQPRKRRIPTNEETQVTCDAVLSGNSPRQAVPRYPWQGRRLGLPCIRGRHSLYTRPIHRQDGTVLEDCQFHRD